MTAKAFTIICLSAAILIGAAGGPAVKAEGVSPQGTYLLNQADGKKQILTLTPGGQAFSQNSGQFDPPVTFGDQQGSWKINNGVIWVRTLDFTTDPNNYYQVNGFGRSLFKMRQKPDGGLSGEVTVEIFPVAADPLDLSPANVPSGVFGPTTFTGKRLTVK